MLAAHAQLRQTTPEFLHFRVMEWVQSLGAVDAVALFVMTLAVARGLWNGAVREAFSLGALAVAAIATRLGTAPVAAWLTANAATELAPWAATGLAAATLFIGSLIAVGLSGRAIRAGVRAAGLGFWDRLMGGAIGATEGALLIAVGIAIATTAVGADHAALAESRTLAAYDAALDLAGGDRLEDVAAPPLDLRR